MAGALMGGGKDKSSGRSSGLFGRRRRRAAMSEINVTPFVDVMLVLLIVFMITAPMLTVAVPVDLPKTQAKNLADNQEPLVISVKADGQIYLQDTKIELDALVPRLKAITGENPDARIFVRGDKSLAYGRMVEVMGSITSGGFTKVALVAELPKSAPDVNDINPKGWRKVGR